MKQIISNAVDSIIEVLQAIYLNSICKILVFIFAKRSIEIKKYRVSLCLIFKNEAPFLSEWIDYHKMLGVNHFYLYNNNSSDNYEEIIQSYVENGEITLIDWPNEQSQLAAYKHCYENYRSDSNWISFLDADEFICLKFGDSIGEWLEDFEKYPSIVVHWKMFGTGGIEKHDYNKLVIEQYHVCNDHFNVLGKCFVNTKYQIAFFNKWFLHHSTHMYFKIGYLRMVLPPVNQFKYFCTPKTMWGHGKKKNDKLTIQINHYFTKAWDVYSSKRNKSDVYFQKNPKLDYSYFYDSEMKCTTIDYLIQRFVMKLKIFRREIF
jgi:hypothetical protein